MKRYFAYVRVSTVKQGEKGSSLQEQRAAIEGYARRHQLPIAEWFEEKETAAKLGRPVFTRLLKALDRGFAAGVIIHKIDRSARNLRDWATLGELLDRGVEMHFAHESIDLGSRGGRLSADIQAVVAADFIRNLRDEVRKGFYGRLRQGLYPLRAPLGYLDQGRGLPKTIDPLRGPMIGQAFELYATGRWSLRTIGAELHSLGLRNRNGGVVTRNGWSTILNNPFYVGIIRLETTGEMFQGVHPPLVHKQLFDQVQAVLRGRLTHKANIYRYRYQRMLRCASCGLSLVAERQKGTVYYRCHTRNCPKTSLRESIVNDALCRASASFKIRDDDWPEIRADIDTALANVRTTAADKLRSLSLAVAAIDERLERLADGYVDQVIDRGTYLARQGKLLGERATLTSRRVTIEAGNDDPRQRVDKNLELIKALGNMAKLSNDDELRDLLKNTTSNLLCHQKKLIIAWENPFKELKLEGTVTSDDPSRIKPRTRRVHDVAKIIIEHCLPRVDDQEDHPDPLGLAA
jgi:site-specific DNA recombinase